jgi:hypothetical protein
MAEGFEVREVLSSCWTNSKGRLSVCGMERSCRGEGEEGRKEGRKEGERSVNHILSFPFFSDAGARLTCQLGGSFV